MDPLAALSKDGLLYLHFRLGAGPSDNYLGYLPDDKEKETVDTLVYPVSVEGLQMCTARLLRVLVNRL
jgi:hypothetical protein